MANITVTASTSNVNVNSTTNTVNVSTTTSNIVVGQTTTVSNAVIRSAITATDPVLYNSTSGVISVNNISLLSGQTTTNLTEGINLYYSNARVQAFIGGNVVSVNSNTTLSNTSLSYSQTLGNSQVVFANSEVAFGGAVMKGGNFAGTGAGNVFYDGSNRGSLTGISSKSIPVTSPNSAEAFFGTFQTTDQSFTTAHGLIVHDSASFKFARLTPFNGSNSQFDTYAEFNLGSSTINSVQLGNNGNVTTSGNISGNYILGNGSQLTNLPTLSNAQVQNYIQTNGLTMTTAITSSKTISTTGNIIGAYLTGDGSNITGVSTLTNAQVISHIATVPLAVGGNLSVTGNIDATGNINYQNVTDLFVRDQKITLNANATTDATVEIISNRPQSTYNAKLTWNEPSEVWTFMNGDNTFHEMLTSTQARGLVSVGSSATPSGNGSLAYNSTTGVFTLTPADTSLATKSTTNLSEGTNLYYTDARSRGAISTATPATPSGGGALAYDNSSGVFTFTPAVPGIALTNLSVTQASASGTGALAYDNSSGVFTYTPPLLTTGDIEGVTAGVGLSGGGTSGTVTLNLDPTITTATASGDGSLAYDNTSGVFTFTPADTSLATKSTTNLAEGTNLYFTTARANTAIGAYTGTMTNVGEITSSGSIGIQDTTKFFSGNASGLLPNTIPSSFTNTQAQGYIVGAGLTNMTANITSYANIQTNTHLITNNLTGYSDGFTQYGIRGINLNLSNTVAAVHINQPMLSNANSHVLDISSKGWAPFIYNNGNPVLTLGGDGAQQNDGAGGPSSNAQPLHGFVANATLTAGSTTVPITGITRLSAYYAGGQKVSTMFNDTANITTIMGEMQANSIPKTGGIFAMTQAPFAKGTYITAIDAAARTVTVSEAPIANATLALIDSPGDSSNATLASQNPLWMGPGAFTKPELGTTGIKYAELYVSYADRVGNVADANYFPIYSITCTLDQFGAPQTGLSTSDLTYTTQNPGSWTVADYTVSGKTTLDVEDGAISAPYGLTIGNTTGMGYKTYNDLSGSTFGINVGWDGEENRARYGGAGVPIPQIGLASFRENTVQESTISNGPRLMFQSRNGNVNISEFDQYPRSGQELGRTTFWGTHGNNINPPTTSAPGYISFAAADDWTDGSNTNAYFVATSNYTDTSSRDPFLSYEKGELIIASGQPTSVQADIRFAPAVQIGNNPQNAYDFSSDAAAAGSKGWASINYANVTATSGAKFSVNNGMSLGAGTVGDMQVSIHRKDNSYALANTDVVIDEFYTGATNSGATGGAQVCDLVGVSGGVTLGSEDRYTFSGITDANWTYLNGNTYTFASSLFGGGFKQLKNVDGSNVVQGGADRGVAQPSIGQPFIVGVVYRIVSVGTTDFTAIGAADNNIGTTFTASGTGSGSGIGSRLLTGQYTFGNSQSSGVTEREYELSLAEQSENLKLTVAGVDGNKQDILEIYHGSGNSFITNHQTVVTGTLSGALDTYSLGIGNLGVQPSDGNFKYYPTDVNVASGTATLDAVSLLNVTGPVDDKANIGTVFNIHVYNQTGNTQTIATANTTPTFSESLANNTSMFYRLTQIGTTVFAEKVV